MINAGKYLQYIASAVGDVSALFAQLGQCAPGLGILHRGFRQ
jgi:hypothetical protein